MIHSKLLSYNFCSIYKYRVEISFFNEPPTIDEPLSREDLENICQNKWKEVERIIQIVLVSFQAMPDYRDSKIHRVFLCGGGSKMPALKRIIENLMKNILNQSTSTYSFDSKIQPEYAVVLGASIKSAVLNKRLDEPIFQIPNYANQNVYASFEHCQVSLIGASTILPLNSGLEPNIEFKGSTQLSVKVRI